ncbi:hypothetical protein [Actinomadura sp. CNU-125]|uniref:hypothetical protein n=1 Tax=Actinomadura sp. CNU-125 TaxID=1904961 RepID=UPI00117876C5|nr:hypothetical protein [Actinomadura sp. CNU-125]
MNNVPPSWIPPEEMRRPTRHPHINLTIAILGSGIIGNETAILVGEYIVAYSRVTMWATQSNPPKDFKEKTLLAHSASETVEKIYKSWLEYATAFRASGGKVGTYENQDMALKITMREAIESLTNMQH